VNGLELCIITILVGGFAFMVREYKRDRDRYYKWHREQQIDGIQRKLDELYEMRKRTCGIVKAGGVGGRLMTTLPELKEILK
jgi:hypothetical protein